MRLGWSFPEGFDGVDCRRVNDLVRAVDGAERACAEEVSKFDGAVVDDFVPEGTVGRGNDARHGGV